MRRAKRSKDLWCLRRPSRRQARRRRQPRLQLLPAVRPAAVARAEPLSGRAFLAVSLVLAAALVPADAEGRPLPGPRAAERSRPRPLPALVARDVRAVLN